MESFTVETRQRTDFIRIDREVQRLLVNSGIQEGVCQIFIPHTTAGVTINENADPDVVRDMALILERMVPWHGGYAHEEGNSAAHVKSSLMGCCQTVLISKGRLVLGTWQSIYFCEFDGPRTRTVHVTFQGV